jgi:hypothetical protein
MALSKMALDTKYFYAEPHYAKFRYAECHAPLRCTCLGTLGGTATNSIEPIYFLYRVRYQDWNTF